MKLSQEQREAVARCWNAAAAEARALARNIDPEAGRAWRYDRQDLFDEADEASARAQEVRRGAEISEKDLDIVPHVLLELWGL